MPLGKHKGTPIDQVPRDYLVWALRNMDCSNPAHDRHWPEFTACLEDLVGPNAPTRPAVLPFAGLVAMLAARGCKLAREGTEVTATGPGVTPLPCRSE